MSFTPGALTAEKVALAMGMKVILVCHNRAHKEFVEKIGIDHIREQLDKPGANTFKVALGDVAEELAALKPPRFEVLEAQRSSGGNKRKAEDNPGEAKRKAMADAFQNSGMPMGNTVTTIPALPKTPSTPSTPKAPAPAPSTTPKAQPPSTPPPVTPPPVAPSPANPAAPAVPGVEPVADLQKLLANFGT